MSNSPRTIEGRIHFRTVSRGARKIRQGQPQKSEIVKPGRLPRVTKLMALAIKFEELLNNGTVKDYADLARLGGVTRAFITQVMNLRLLAPHIQEKLIFHERVNCAKDAIKLRDLQALVLEVDWQKQLTAVESILVISSFPTFIKQSSKIQPRQRVFTL